MMKELTNDEVARRVAIVKRFRELLKNQRERFSRYIDVLDKQKEVIESGSPDSLIAHVELEEEIVTDIFAIQKVIDPLESLYQTLAPENADANIADAALPEEREVHGLKAALSELRAEAVVRSERNRSLLSRRMEELRAEMKTLRKNPYALHKSPYAAQTATLVDVRG
jgi:hypothetical protein